MNNDIIQLDVSVIIPCFNEEATIGKVITAVKNELHEGKFLFEIIVVDNGSFDGSTTVAKKHNAKVLTSQATTVAGVRNMGAKKARGKVFVFLDADVIVQASWGANLRGIFDLLASNEMITGSHCSVPDDIPPLLGSWYNAIANDRRDTHFGTGHMIVSSYIFDKLDGFNQDIITGEDYDFCLRAKTIGVAVVSNPRLIACHLGFPNTFLGFAKREIWHGEGDCANWQSVLRSKVAVCGIACMSLTFLTLVFLFFDAKISTALVMLLFIEVTTVNYYKFGFGEPHDFFSRSIVAYFYLLSRGLALPFSILKITQS